MVKNRFSQKWPKTTYLGQKWSKNTILALSKTLEASKYDFWKISIFDLYSDFLMISLGIQFFKKSKKAIFAISRSLEIRQEKSKSISFWSSKEIWPRSPPKKFLKKFRPMWLDLQPNRNRDFCLVRGYPLKNGFLNDLGQNRSKVEIF